MRDTVSTAPRNRREALPAITAAFCLSSVEKNGGASSTSQLIRFWVLVRIVVENKVSASYAALVMLGGLFDGSGQKLAGQVGSDPTREMKKNHNVTRPAAGRVISPAESPGYL